MRAYLDCAASLPLLPGVAGALSAAPAANPSSLHAEGRAARAALDAARDRAAAALGCSARELVFCSGGTESVAIALLGAGRRLPRGRRFVTYAAEHQAVLGCARRLRLEGVEVSVLSSDAGSRPAEPLPADTGLVSIGFANSETGALQPVAEIADAARRLGALVHVDACQGIPWLPPPLAAADLLSISGHKVGAGRGGLLFARREAPTEPLFEGGPQEWGRRPGREDPGAAAALALALELCARHRAAWSATAAGLGARLRAALAGLGPDAIQDGPVLPGHAWAAFSGRRGEDLLVALDLAGVAASSGSACASGSLDPSHVALAMGLGLDAASGTLRLSAGPATTTAEVDLAVSALEGLAARA